MKIEINIKDQIFEKLKSNDVEKLINELLDGYLNYGSLNYVEMSLWRKHIELKLAEIQNEIDQHRKKCKCEPASVLDSNLSDRLTGKKSVLDVNEFRDLQQSDIKPKKNKQSGNQIPIIDGVIDIPL